MKELAFTLPGYYRVLIPDAARHNADDIVAIINWLPGFIIVLILLFSLFFLGIAGYTWITSRGDKTKLEEVRKIITYVIIGLTIMVFSFLILRFVGQYIFGFSELVNLERQQPIIPIPTSAVNPTDYCIPGEDGCR